MTAFIETYRGSVASWECDQYGHMNVQFYIGRVSDAAVAAMLARGMGPKAMESRRLGVVAVESRISHRRELRAGALIRMESALKSIEGRKIVFVHRLFDGESGALAMQVEVLGLCFDLEARKSVPFPDEFIRLSRDDVMVADEPGEQHAIPAPRDGMLPSFCGPVNAWDCDRMGHMNVQFYMHRAAEADRQVFAALGLGPAALAALNAGIRPLRYQIKFSRELHSGDATAMRSGIRRVAADHLAVVHQLFNSETGEVAAIVEAGIGLIRLADDAPLALPAGAAERAERLAAAFAGPAELTDQTGPRVPEIPGAGLIETHRGSAERWECDAQGRLAMRFYVSAFSAAWGDLQSRIAAATKPLEARGLGAAALDYIIVIRRPLKLGDAYHLRTEMLELREKTWRFCHFVIDSRSGAVAATVEIVSVLFDLATRKSVAMPEDVRRFFASLN